MLPVCLVSSCLLAVHLDGRPVGRRLCSACRSIDVGREQQAEERQRPRPKRAENPIEKRKGKEGKRKYKRR